MGSPVCRLFCLRLAPLAVPLCTASLLAPCRLVLSPMNPLKTLNTRSNPLRKSRVDPNFECHKLLTQEGFDFLNFLGREHSESDRWHFLDIIVPES